MAINYNDPYNQGIGTLDVGNMNLGQVPVDNMQQANWLNTISGGMMGTTPEQDAQNAALEQIQEIKGTQFEGYPTGTNPAWVEEHKTEYPDLYEKYQNKQKQIQDLKRQFPQNINIQQAYLDDEYSDIEGQTAGLGVASFLVEKFGPKLGAYLFKTGKNKALKEIGKKVKPIITGVLTGGAAQATQSPQMTQRREGRGGTHMSRSRDQGGLGISQSQAQAVSDANRAAGMSGWGLARGGRVSYFDGGLLSLWPR